MIASAHHHSWQDFFRHPFGAVATGAAVTLRLELSSQEPAQCFLHLHEREGNDHLYPMALSERSSAPERGRAVYEYTVTMPARPGLLWYDFEIKCGHQYYYYGCAVGSGGEGRLSTAPLKGFQITVYAPAPVPAWFKNSLVYQIFPDRFHSSLPPGQYRPAGRRRILHTDWNDVPFYNRAASGAIERWDFFGGDLPGITAKLPYLEQLGVDAVYLNPIFQAASNHRYDTANYHRIDPLLGDEADLRRLCQEAARAGIRIILDGVFAHSGDDSIYFNRFGHYPTEGACQSKQSPYYDWYRFEQWPHTYKCWWGVEALPWLDCHQDSYRDFIYRSPDSVLNHWMECGVSGWRLDVADELPDQFIAEFKSALRAADPESVLIGEVWEDASHKVSYGELRRYFEGYELDSVTNYPLRQVLLDYLLGQASPEAVWRCMMQLYENYPPDNFQAALNLIGSHDRPRILTLLGEAPPEATLNESQREHFRLSPDAERKGLERLRLMLLLQMLLPGAACIYYGDEAGLQGYSDPYNRGTFPWEQPNEELELVYHRLVGLRRQYRDLLGGSFTPIYDDGDVLGFRLRREDEELLVCANRGSEVKSLECCCVPAGRPAEHEDSGADSSWNINRGLRFEQRPLRLVDLLDKPEHHRYEDEASFAVLSLPPLSGKAFYIRYPAAEDAAGGAQGSHDRAGAVTPPLLPGPRRRAAGILLHLSSLPSPWGIGTMGSEAFSFIDFLAAAGQRIWQVLPLNPVGGHNSPYQSSSLWAGNPRLISPEGAVMAQLLTPGDLEEWRAQLREHSARQVDFPCVAAVSHAMLHRAFDRFKALDATANIRAEYDAYREQQRSWLGDYALHAALREHLGLEDWRQWPRPLARREPAVLDDYRARLWDAIAYHCFVQFVFDRQWRALKTYANARGIAVVGDLPIYAAADGSDTWAAPRLFLLDDDGYPTHVAGVPPDYFCAAGQLWDNPLYDWRAMEADGYSWWIRRARQGLELFDYLRLDHFRGLEAGWAVPAGRPDAIQGQWRHGPGRKLLRALERSLGSLPFIAENLGFITREVESLRECFDLPGMIILQFAALDAEHNPVIPPGEHNSVLYSGTHDNETLLGWARGRAGETRTPAEETALTALADELLEKMYAAASPWVIVPLQDVLLLDNEARMNVPGMADGNWGWRAVPDELSSAVAARLYARTARTARCGGKR